MRDLLILFIHFITTLARLARPGGLRSVIAESVLIKHQLLILHRSRRRAPNLRLQVADLLAWELTKEFEGMLSRPMRWELKQMLGSYMSDGHIPLIRLFDKDEMLRTIVESGFQFTEGTEVITDIDTQMMVSQERMSLRLAERTKGWKDEEEEL